MGIVRLTASGKAVQFITDDGVQYVVALAHLQGYLANGNKPFIVLSRLADLVSPERYPKSPVWDPGGSVVNNSEKLTTDNDAHSRKVATAKEHQIAYVDKEVSW
jgi:hypothetical protein